MNAFSTVAAAAISMMLAAADPAAGAPPAAPAALSVPVIVDHHVHLHSPAILAFLPGYCASPSRTSKCEPDFTRPLKPEDLLHAMDAAGIKRAWIMSTGYLAESPLMGPLVPNHADILRAANDFTVGLAQRYPTRFDAYIGVNPVTPTALGEIARWRGNPHVAGIKLHLANSHFDFHDPEQVKQLATVFRTVAAQHQRIMIHMRNGATGYGAEEAKIFIRDVLPAGRGTRVQIAHLAGWGGIDAPTLAALGVFADASEADRATCRDLTFDLAAIRPEKVSAADQATLVALMRRIGVDHFVTASDWPFSMDLKAYYASLETLPLTPQEWQRIVHNDVD
ncbi:amidohydrolase [Sphingomonas sp. AP4-R1]|uniref:amidohydrolase family protein n=1 Tax=Sphingomonas sp. AP4-R1 TaxID=2735134 RepID=UPI001493D39F|nr:amidohydrolase [Sphingomonas sp. AP4-R1]QJU60151.1 amidohydrolase [Sphingomonas sp. AP4-R1]